MGRLQAMETQQGLFNNSCRDGAGGRPEQAAAAHLQQGIRVLMRRWTGLQMALQNEWGGRDSPHKYDHLILHLFSCLSQSKGPVCVEELEGFLHETMLLCFNTEMEDGSIELVAEQLAMMHEDYLHGCSNA